MKTIQERFWEKVNKTNNLNECWNWTGAKRTKYGSIKYKGKLIDAHRLSYMIYYNNYNINSTDFVCHKCDNPSCVNPNHLFLGSHSDNMKDAYLKGRIIIPQNIKQQFITPPSPHIKPQL